MMKKIFAYALALIFTLSAVLSVSSVSEKSLSWYTKREKNNCQPKLDPQFSFINNYDAYWLDYKYSDDSADKAVYLTFDAGYENGNVERILNVLKEKNAPGAFFILSHFIESEPDLVKRMIEEGHTVCNHTSKHKDMSKITDREVFRSELESLEKKYFDITGYEMSKLYRPPEGKFSEDNLRIARDLGYKTVFWSLAYADWDNNNQPSSEKAKKLILDNLHNGAVILLHPTSSTNANILGSLIDEIRYKGYEIKSIENLFSDK